MVKEWKQLKCSICGGELTEHGNKLACKYCRAIYECVERISEDEVIQLNQATVQRNLLLFDDAYERYELILKSYPSNSEAAWGAFLCSYGIIYEQDYDGTYKPTCHRLNECPVEKSPYYSKLTGEAKTRAKEIENLRQSILAQAKSISPYDVFICYKATDDWHGRSMPTKETQWARDLYELLVKKFNLKVFFSEKSLADSNTDYEPHIYSALQSAKIMFILTSSLDHINAVWVQNEWRRYTKYIREGQKKLVRVIYENIDPYMLPRILQQKQAINHNANSWVQHVENCIKTTLFNTSSAPTKTTSNQPYQLTPTQIENAQKLFLKANEYANSNNYKTACEYYEKAANLGHAESQYILGACYKKGKGIRKDFNKAVYWYQKAADQGLDKGQCYLGYSYEYAQGVDKDYKKAAYYYHLAAIQGHPTAQYHLGAFYKHGTGVSRNFIQAVYWLKLSAAQENDHAQYNLGLCYEKGEGVKADLEKAVFFYQKAAAHGHASAQEKLDNLRSTVLIVQQKRKQAEKVYAIACNYLSQKNYLEAAKYLDQAAKLGYDKAQDSLACLYHNGTGVTLNYQTAAYWFDQAALYGNLNARYNLGVCYETGKGVSQDYQKAFDCYAVCKRYKHEKAIERIKIIQPQLNKK